MTESLRNVASRKGSLDEGVCAHISFIIHSTAQHCSNHVALEHGA